MVVTKITPIRLNETDKAMLAELAARLGKNRSDIIRALIRERLAILREQDPQSAQVKPQAREHAETKFITEWRKTA